MKPYHISIQLHSDVDVTIVHALLPFITLSPLTLSRLMSSSLLSLSCKSVAAALFFGEEPDSPRGMSAGETLAGTSAPLTPKILYKIPRWKFPFRNLGLRRLTLRENIDFFRVVTQFLWWCFVPSFNRTLWTNWREQPIIIRSLTSVLRTRASMLDWAGEGALFMGVGG